MFRRRRPRARRAPPAGRRIQRQRRLTLEMLEERRLLAVMTVTNLDDDTLANLAGDSQLSLREAIEAINTGAAVDGIGPTSGIFGTDDEIQFAPGLFTSGPQAINLADVAGARQLTLTRAMTITGPGATLLRIDGGDGTDGLFNTGDGFRILDINDGTGIDRPVTLLGLTLTGGDVNGGGGAIRAMESLTLNSSIVTGNAAVGNGGGILFFNSGSSNQVIDSRFTYNVSNGSGGGIYSSIPAEDLLIERTTIAGNGSTGVAGGGALLATTTGQITIRESTIALNVNTGGGGGGGLSLSFAGAGSALIESSTISLNLSDDDGGGLNLTMVAGATTTIRHSTIAQNSSDDDGDNDGFGGGLFTQGPGTLDVDHTIIADNTDFSGTAPDLDIVTSAPTTFDLTFSLIGDNTGSGLTEAPLGAPDADGNLIGDPGGGGVIDPLLGLLANNGGPTETHALLMGSPAIDAGDAAAMAGMGGVPEFDQRGAPFIRDFDAGGTALIDIGAYERQTVIGLNLVVDTLVDENDGDYSAGDLSLREAVGLANGSVGADTITFAAPLSGGTILLTLGEIRITSELDIDASGLADRITIDASGNDDDVTTDNGGGSRIFVIDDELSATDNSVALRRLVLTGGDEFDDGGAILTRETLSLFECLVANNHSEFDGGGIAVLSPAGSFELNRSTIANNSADDGGGGLHIDGVESLIVDSTISGNFAEVGGGVRSDTDDDGTPSTTISNSTVSGNTATSTGGGIYNFDGLMVIQFSTITDNSAADGAGSGVASFGDNATITRVYSTIISANDLSDVDFVDGVTNSFESLGYNLIGMGNAIGEFVAVGDDNNVANPGLGFLSSNGGPTQTHQVLSTSPALDAGEPGLTPGVGGVPSFDQRGAPITRIFDGNGNAVATIDIGAFELIEQPLLPDDFEDNDTFATASPLGSPPFETIRNLTIHDTDLGEIDLEPPDEDYYKYVAHDTGKLYVRIYFTHALGDLDLHIHDRNDNIIAASISVDDDEELIIPVVGQQMYVIHVFGAGGEIDTNEYTLEIENFPAPVPTGIVLDPASDSGMMDNDEVTSDNTPTLYIQTDVLNFIDTNGTFLFEDPDTALNPDAIDVLTAAEAAAANQAGIAVQVTLVNTTTLTSTTFFADPLITNSPEVYILTIPDGMELADGVYLVTARTVVFDPLESLAQVPTPAVGRSNGSPPLRLVVDTVGAPEGGISADMLDASDTGMFDDDNVTNKMQPAFQGIAPANAKVRLFANGELVGQSVVGSDTSDVGHAVGGIGGLANDGLGLWEITVEPLADNGYDIRVEVEDGAGNVTEFDPHFNGVEPRIDIIVDTLEPNTPFLDLVDDTGRHDNDNVTKDNTPQVTMTSTDPNINLAQILFQDNLKFRIYDRFEGAAEFLLYDSALDVDVDAISLAGDMFTSLTFIGEVLPEQFFALFGANGVVLNSGGIGVLADGVHNLKLEVEDRAGNISHDFLLEITIDTLTPPIAFGLPDGINDEDGLTASSDTGVTTEPQFYADRVTSDTTPTFWGRAEADTIVRLYLDRDADGIIDLNTDTFLGQTTAIPLDGNDAYPDGYWEITSALDLNQLVGLPKDGVRRLLATAEDVAGNPMPMFVDELPQISDGVAALQIFIDTQGPQIVDVNLGPEIDYDLFDPKPSTDGPTPLVHSLFIDIRDLPFRIDQPGSVNDFLYDALVENIAETIGNYELVGDHVGQVIIEDVIVHFDAVVSGEPAFARIELVFADPLPDDRYTLTVRDNLVDPAGNKLDGESGNPDPFEEPNFPTGDGVPGGNFVARFTVDSRPEIGVWAAGIVHIDTNGNFHFDPENLDFVNRDLVYTLGFSSDYIFAGNFALGGVADGFDKLAVYGRVGDQWRFLIDFDNDGVPDEEFLAPAINGIPVAGNFDGNAANGDEVGVFTGSAWFFDTNHDFIVDDGFATDYAGFPVAGDFDGDGDDDVGTYIASQAGGNFFHIDINTAGLGSDISINGSADHRFRVGIPSLGTFGFAGVRERPVAADMNADGVDDLGLWVPDGTAILPGDQGEWFFLISESERVRYENGEVGLHVTNTVIDRIIGGGAADFVPFSTTPFGDDLYARFGNSFALPIVGNFDPPVSPTSQSPSTQSAPPPSTPTATTPPVSSPTVAAPAAASNSAPTTVAAPVTAPPTTTATATKVAVPPVTKAAPPNDSSNKSIPPTNTTKAAKKLTVPNVQGTATKPAAAATTVAKTTAATKSTKNVAKLSASPVIPPVTTVAKVTKATAAPAAPTKVVKQASAVVAAEPVVVAKSTAAPAVVTATAKAAKKASAVSLAAPVDDKVVKSTAVAAVPAKAQSVATQSEVQQATPRAKAAPTTTAKAAAAKAQPQTVVVPRRASEPISELKRADARQVSHRALVTKTTVASRPVKEAVVVTQSSTLSGNLQSIVSAPADPAPAERSMPLAAATVDAAVADLNLTLADLQAAVNAIADRDADDDRPDASDGQVADADHDATAFEMAWETVLVGVA